MNVNLRVGIGHVQKMPPLAGLGNLFWIFIYKYFGPTGLARIYAVGVSMRLWHCWLDFTRSRHNPYHMESAEEFVRRYLREKADRERSLFKAGVVFYEKYFTNDWNKYRLDFDAERQDEHLISIEVSDQIAHFITIHPYKDFENRSRYLLCVVDNHWKISSKQSECIDCRGRGNNCSACDGSGWRDYVRNSAPPGQKSRFPNRF
jgi:hypothetical protein